MSKQRRDPAASSHDNRKQRRARASIERRSTRRARRAALTGAALALGLGVNAHVARADQFVVLSASDDLIASPSDATTLRGAIAAANAHAGADTITFNLGSSNNLITLADELAITDSVQIQGPGSNNLTLDGAYGSRIFKTGMPGNTPPISVGVSGLAFQHARTPNLGGSIWAQRTELTLDDVLITDSHADGDGGAIYASDSALTLSQSNISACSSNGDGGAISLQQGTSITITDSGLGQNSAYTGGALDLVDLGGDSTIDRTTLSGNVASFGDGGAIALNHLQADASFAISSSTLFANSGVNVGGINVQWIDGEFSILNSTISGNIGAVSAAISLDFAHGGTPGLGKAEVEGSTIFGNVTGPSGQAVWVDGDELELSDTIVYRTLYASSTFMNDIAVGPDGEVELNYCIIGMLPVGITLPADSSSADPKLATLADNGGPTQTHLPASDSPAIDMGDPEFEAEPGEFDQRGEARVQGYGVDIGAVEVTPDPNAPLLDKVADTSTAAGVATSAIALTITDGDTPLAGLTVSATSSNQTVIPDANIVVGESNGQATLTITPAASVSGDVIITVDVTDGTHSGQRKFKLTVTASNQPPTISDVVDQTTNEDTATSAINFTVGDTETAAASLVVTGTSNAQSVVANSGIALGGTGASRTVTVTPVANASGEATITLTVTDGAQATATDTFKVTVSAINDSPTISQISDTSTNEDTAKQVSFTVGDVDGDTVTVTGVSSNTALVANASVVVSGTGASRMVTITPAQDQTGFTDITLTANDGHSGTASRMFRLTVNAVNDPPTISLVSDTSTNVSTAKQVSFTVGDVDGDTISLTGTSSNHALVLDSGVVIAPPSGAAGSRSVTITPVANQTGATTITLAASDGHSGTANRTFMLTVAAVNVPTITSIADQRIDVNSTATDLTVTVGDAETAAANLIVTAASSNTTLVPNTNITVTASGTSRTLTIAPAADQSGTTTITLTVRDGDDFTSTTSFDLTVNAAPTISEIDDQNIDEDSQTGDIAFTIDDTETVAASLVVTASSSNTTLVDASGVVLGGSGANRTIKLIPIANQSGTTEVTITVSDGLHASNRTFELNVGEVADAPAITGISDVAIDRGEKTAAIPFTVSDSDTALSALVVTVASSNTRLVPLAGIELAGSGAERTLTVTPNDALTGFSQITVTVSDGTSSAARAFTLTVNPVAHDPTISEIDDQTILESTSTGPLWFTVGDPDGDEGLTVTATSSNTTLLPNDGIVLGGSGAERTIKLTPRTKRSGTASVTVVVSDGEHTASTEFALSVTAADEMPGQTVDGGKNEPETKPDAGTDEEPGSSPEADSGPEVRTSSKKSGGCSVTQPSATPASSGSLFGGLLGLLAVFGVRRRSRRR